MGKSVLLCDLPPSKVRRTKIAQNNSEMTVCLKLSIVTLRSKESCSWAYWFCIGVTFLRKTLCSFLTLDCKQFGEKTVHGIALVYRGSCTKQIIYTARSPREHERAPQTCMPWGMLQGHLLWNINIYSTPTQLSQALQSYMMAYKSLPMHTYLWNWILTFSFLFRRSSSLYIGKLDTIHPVQSLITPINCGLPANTAATGACLLQKQHPHTCLSAGGISQNDLF